MNTERGGKDNQAPPRASGNPSLETTERSASHSKLEYRLADSRKKQTIDPEDSKERLGARGSHDIRKEAPPSPHTKRDASSSPEPFRQRRERLRDRHEGGSRGMKDDLSRENKDRDRARDKGRDRSRDKDTDRPRDKRRDRSRDRRKDRSKDRHRDRSRSRDRKRSERSKSPLPYASSNKRRDRSASPPRRRRHDSRSRSPNKRRKRSPSHSPHQRSRPRKPLPDQEVTFRGLDDSALPPTKYGGAPTDREKPNFKPTGLLAKEANKIEGTKISLKYHEPPEARKPPPSAQWRLWIFKGADTLGTIELFTQSCWLLGRAAEVADIVLEHPSCSQQHAAIQFRYIVKTVEDEYGVRQQKGKVKLYVIDLESSNGTELNGEELEAGRYFELRDKDILKFGGSEREYVIMLPPKE